MAKVKRASLNSTHCNTNMHAETHKSTYKNKKEAKNQKEKNSSSNGNNNNHNNKCASSIKPVCIICDGILLFPLSSFRLINQFWLLFKINLNGIFSGPWNVCSRYVARFKQRAAFCGSFQAKAQSNMLNRNPVKNKSGQFDYTKFKIGSHIRSGSRNHHDYKCFSSIEFAVETIEDCVFV